MAEEDFKLTGEPRLTFLDLAERYLRELGRPLSAREIVSAAIRDGMLASVGQTPWQTMKAKLSTDILAHGEKSRFKRIYQGVFALRDYDAEEYHANRFIKGKLDEEIAVISREKLPVLVPSPGFTPNDVDRALLRSIAKPMQRRLAEECDDVVQLVSVFVVTHERKYLTHMRSGRLPESRLRGEYSMMLGGHLSIEDFSQLTLDLFGGDEDLSDCTYILRELSEELVLQSDPLIEARGYLYDDSRQVSKQHVGLVYQVTIPTPNFQIGERGFLLHPRMESISEISSRRCEFENWSWILMDHIEEVCPEK